MAWAKKEPEMTQTMTTQLVDRKRKPKKAKREAVALPSSKNVNNSEHTLCTILMLNQNRLKHAFAFHPA